MRFKRRSPVKKSILSVIPVVSDLFQNFPQRILYKSQFYPIVRALFQQAQKSIYIMQYEFFVSPGQAKHQINFLANDLHCAVSRGVLVQVLLNRAFHNQLLRNKQLITQKKLSDCGIQVKLYRDGVCCHPKVIIIDDKYVIVGSHNLTVTALTKNIEVSVAICSVEVAKEMVGIFQDLWGFC